MVDLATLVVKLEAQTSAYVEGMNHGVEATMHLSEVVGEQVNKITERFLEFESLKKAFEFTEKIAEDIAHLTDLSAALGISSQRLSELQYAAKLTGVDDIAQPLEHMARAAGEAEQGNVKLIAAFRSVGVSINDLKTLTPDEVYLKIADGVSKYADGLGKTATVQTIFGRSNAQLIEQLNEGSKGFEEASKEAQIFGISVSNEAARATNQWKTDLERIGAVFTGVFRQGLVAALPVLQDLTKQIITFAKTSGVIQQAAAGIAAGIVGVVKLIESLGPIVEGVLNLIEAVLKPLAEELTPGIRATQDALVELFGTIGAALTHLSQDKEVIAAIVDEVGTALKLVITAGAVVIDTFSVAIRYIQGTLDVYDKFLQTPSKSDWLLHPIESTEKFNRLSKEAQQIAKDTFADINSTLDKGDVILDAIWGKARANVDSYFDRLKNAGTVNVEVLDSVNKALGNNKPQLKVFDLQGLAAFESGVEKLVSEFDKLNQQVQSFGLGIAAATVFDLTLGKLSASVDLLNKKSPSEAKLALEDLEKQGKLSKAVIDEINAAIAAGVPIGDAFKTSIINSADALDRLKGIDALSKLDSELLTMTGHLEEASKAAFDLANRPLQITIRTAQDKSAFSGLDDTQKTAEATQQLNTLKQQAIAIEDALGKKVADVDATAAAAGENNLRVAGEEAVARQAAIAQLEALYVKAEALAEATGLKSAADQARALRDAIGAIQFNPKILEDVDKATEAQKRFNEALKDEKNANDDLSLQLAGLAKQNAEGALTDLDYAAKQDEARQRAIDQLMAIQQQELEVVKNNPGNAQALDDYKKLGVQITELQTQMGQLAKTIRTDLTDSLSNAFVDFADGSKSASAALRAFVADFTKEMLQLGSKALFQKLFDTTGISSGINSLFGAASKALPAAASATGDLASTTAAATSATGDLANTTAAATSLSTAITTAATTGGTAMGTAVSTAATAAATEMGTAITTAGHAAAAEMAAAIGGSGAVSGVGAAGAAAIVAAAGGGPIPANQLTLVGEVGPELFVSDLGESSAATATQAGTVIPEDLTHAHVVGTGGPEFIRPNVSGFVVPSDKFLAALGDRGAPAAPPAIPAGPDVSLRTESPRPLAPVIELIPGLPAPPTILRTTLPAHSESLFAKPEATAAEMPEPPASVNNVTPIRASVESRGAPPIESAPPIPSNVIAFPAQPPALPSPPTPIETAVAGASNVIAFPLPKQPVSGAEFAATMLDVASALPSAADRLDTEVTRASAPEIPAQFDEPNSEMVMKFEKIVKHEQADMLDAHEYEALLTDRYLQRRQGGGPVNAGQPYLVGEGGPELMVPDSSGTVMNSWETQNHRAVVNNVMNHFVINTPTGKVDRTSQGQIAARTAASVQAASARNN